MLASIKKLTQHSLIYGLGHIVARSIGFLLLPLHTNFFDREIYGVASLLFAYVAILTVVYGLGIDAAFLRYYILAENAAEKRSQFGTAFWALGLSSIGLSLLQFGLAGELAALVLGGQQYSYLIQLAAGILLFDALAFIPFLLLRAEERSQLFAVLKIGHVIASFVLNYLFIITWQRGIAGIFEANLIASVFAFASLMPLFRTRLQLSFDTVIFKRFIVYGLPFLPSTFAIIAIDIQDRFFLKALSDLETVGLYSAGYRLGMVMGLVITAFRFAWVPFFLKTSQQDHAREIFARVLTYFCFLMAFVFLSVSFFIDDIVRLQIGAWHLFGKDYWNATTVVPVIMLAYCLYGLDVNFLIGITLKEKTGYLPLISGTGAAVNAISNLVLIPRFGMMGAAWATVIAHGTMALMMYHFSQRLYSVSYEFQRVVRITAVAAFLYFLNHYLPPTIPIKLLLLLSYPAILFFGGFLNPGELQIIKRLFSQLKPADR